MSIEIGNALHAMATVGFASPGHALFLGQGNVGFAPFGTGPTFSERVANGQFRMHLLDGINFAAGEGLVFTNIFVPDIPFPLLTGNGIQLSLPFLVPSTPGADVLVQTSVGGMPADVEFMLVVLRFPQQSTG
jgi:hypothetical protein